MASVVGLLPVLFDIHDWNNKRFDNFYDVLSYFVLIPIESRGLPLVFTARVFMRYISGVKGRSDYFCR